MQNLVRDIVDFERKHSTKFLMHGNLHVPFIPINASDHGREHLDQIKAILKNHRRNFPSLTAEVIFNPVRGNENMLYIAGFTRSNYADFQIELLKARRIASKK